MSGRIVPFVGGGPMDGRERHRALSTGGAEEVTYSAGQGLVHVYEAARDASAPFRYEGVRPWRSGDTNYPTLLNHGSAE